MLEMELQKRLKLDVVEEKLLLTLMQYEKDRNMVRMCVIYDAFDLPKN